MKSAKIVLCLLNGLPFCFASEADSDLVMVQTQVSAQQLTAQRALFSGLEQLEPDLVRTALAALTVRGQKVSAQSVVAALEKSCATRLSALRWSTFGSASFMLYGAYYATKSFWDFCRNGGFWQGIDTAEALFGLSVGACAFALIMIKSNVARIIRIIDALVGADQALDFGGDVQAFTTRIFALREKMGGASVQVRILRSEHATEKIQ